MSQNSDIYRLTVTKFRSCFLLFKSDVLVMKQILYDMGIFFRSTTPLYEPYHYVNGSIRTVGSRGVGVIIEKMFYCFISCFGPFAAFFVAKCKFILEFIKVQCSVSCRICDKIFVINHI